MKTIQIVSRLIRLPNILMVILTMYLMRWSIVIPILDYLGYDPAMPEWSFGLLVLSTVLITAAGNVINDFHDVNADRANQPERVVIYRYVSRRQAIISHLILNSTGATIGVFISFHHWLPWLSVIFLSVPMILWLYSLSFKHQPVIGNLVVSLLTATVPLLVILFEYPLLSGEHMEELVYEPNLFKPIIWWILIFAVFAFLSNFIRELVKDGEDVAGDQEIGSKTLALMIGMSNLKILVLAISGLTLTALAVIFIAFLPDLISLIYFGLFLAIPFAYLMILVARVKKPEDWRKASLVSKLIMLFGLTYAPVAFLLIDSLNSLV